MHTQVKNAFPSFLCILVLSGNKDMPFLSHALERDLLPLPLTLSEKWSAIMTGRLERNVKPQDGIQIFRMAEQQDRLILIFYTNSRSRAILQYPYCLPHDYCVGERFLSYLNHGIL